MQVRSRALACAYALIAGCGSGAVNTPPPVTPAPTSTPVTPTPARAPFTLTIVGTNDLHGALDRLPILAGYVANVRAARAADGGAVLLLDGGDMFQGTLESNLGEGADVVRAYNQLGYAAVAVGNHEFDYGPVGPLSTAPAGGDDNGSAGLGSGAQGRRGVNDQRGALKARASEAKFPFLVSNIFDAATHARIDWPNMPASTLVEVNGVKVGIIGVSTKTTPFTTMPVNFRGLEMAPPVPAVAGEAQQLRAHGATIVIVVGHLGSDCKDVRDPDDTSSCDKAEELFPLLEGLPKGAVDAIVAAHTHAVVAHRIAGVAAIESLSSGRAFGRIDLAVGSDGRVASSKIFPPQPLCALNADGNAPPIARPGEPGRAAPPKGGAQVDGCHPDAYEGKPVVPDPSIQAIADEAIARAGARRDEKLGVTLTSAVRKAHGDESAEGNWVCDLMRAARPDAQIAMTNGGGLRADLPAGELTYGQLFTALPFDNRFSLLDVPGQKLHDLVASNLGKGGAILSWSGLSATATCKAGVLDVQVKVNGKPLDPAKTYEVATSDFLASGGDGLMQQLQLAPAAIHDSDVIIREAVADVIRARKGKVDPAQLLVPKHHRLVFEGKRPVKCTP